jgi:hypothetical protein
VAGAGEQQEQQALALAAAPARGGGVPDAVLARDLLDLLARHPLGLRRVDVRQQLSQTYAGRLPPGELAVLDTRIGHALARLKGAGDVVHLERHRRYQLRPRGIGDGAAHEPLPAPPVGDLTGLDDAEQDALF